MSITESVIRELPFREIGPAFMGGRIADIAVDPRNGSTWYVAVGSGGVWKTTNAGTTWSPIFDDQPSFSIGCLTLDPQNPDIVWVGSGEAVSGRHVAWGTGVYRSRNGGKTWDHMGLDRSEHIGEILVDPRDSKVIHVAAEGPLWSPGGERGVYTSVDGGQTWEAVLTIDEDTGITSLAMAPDGPDTLYAAAYQRRRSVAAFLGGGAGSGIYKSIDGGASWRQVSEGLPTGDMGKIGLAVTPADPTILYATIEAEEDDRGFYRSTNRGESWVKQNKYISGGTGPHYYQEIFASPTNSNRVYQVDVFMHWTADGGKTIHRLESGKTKHSDNHAVWIDPANGDHLLIGCDAGLYETFDHGETFRHFPNLPISQFYRVAADNAEPFYNLLAGAQDLGTLYGPSRTMSVEGVRNQDWTVTLGADGYHVAFDPNDPDIGYMEIQGGYMVRLDRATMEAQAIRPRQPTDDPPERYNWDCPFFVSPHADSRLYAASQRVWRSDDRGDTWTPVSPDLTLGLNRYELPISIGGVPKTTTVDALWDHMAMSYFGTISHIDESPLTEGVLYAGTDDGLIQVSEDGGESWRTTASLPDFEPTADHSRVPFINNVRASLHDAAGVFAVVDAHKDGDYSPYVYASTDRGASWTSIAGDLPHGTIVWCLQQDHVDPDLLFVGTESGVYTSIDHGQHWHRIETGMPTISIRDLVIHRRDDDLIAASFGRGIFILDDYSALRAISTVKESTAALFPLRDAWWYVPHELAQAPGQPTLGSSAFKAANPDFGATITYWLPNDIQSAKHQRRTEEKAADEAGETINFPGLDRLWDEHVDSDPGTELIVRDLDGTTVRRIPGANKAGLHRLAWDLRLPAADPPKLKEPEFQEPWMSPPQGPLVAPGTYSIELVHVTSAGTTEHLAGPENVLLKPIPSIADREDGTAVALTAEAAVFDRAIWDLHRRALRAAEALDRSREDAKKHRLELAADPTSTAAEREAHETHHRALEELKRRLQGDAVLEGLSEPQGPSIVEAVSFLSFRRDQVTSAPTTADRDELAELQQRFRDWQTAQTAQTAPTAQTLVE